MEDLEEILTCAVCLDFFKSPRRLSCHHVYCLECIRDLVDRESNVLNCPECRAEHVIPDVDKVPVDHRIVTFIEFQKKLPILTKSELNNPVQAEGASSVVENKDVLGLHEKNVKDLCPEQTVTFLMGTLMQDFINFFSEILSDKNKELILEQKKELIKKLSVICVTRKQIQDAMKDVKKQLDQRSEELNAQLDDQEETIHDALKQFNFMDTISKDLIDRRNGMLDKIRPKEELLSARDQLKQNREKVIKLFTIGTTHKALNSVSFDKTFKDLMDLIQLFGELVEHQHGNIDYNKKWEILSIAEEAKDTMPIGVSHNPYNGHIYVTFTFRIIEYDQVGNEVKRYETNDRPIGVAFDRKKRMIVTSWDHKVKIYDSEGEMILHFGSHGTGLEQFDNPCGVAVDSEDRLHIVDKGNKRIQVFNSEGVFIGNVDGTINKLILPVFIQIQKSTGNRVLVSDYSSGKIFLFDSEGHNYTFIKSLYVPGPSGLSLDVEGNLVVASLSDEGIYVFDVHGEQLAYIKEPVEAFVSMNGIVITDSGVMCVTSRAGGKVFFLYQPHQAPVE